MRPFYAALIRRIFYFLAGLSLSLTGVIGGVFMLRRTGAPGVRFRVNVTELPYALDLAAQAPALAMSATIVIAMASIAAATYVEHRYPVEAHLA